MTKHRTRRPVTLAGLVSEEDIQRTIIDGLTAMRYTVVQTSRRRRPCETCGQVDRRGDGVTQGCPDLLVTHRNWPDGMWLGLEVKGPTTVVSEEQTALAAAHRIYIVRSWEEANRIVKMTSQRTDQGAYANAVLAMNAPVKGTL